MGEPGRLPLGSALHCPWGFAHEGRALMNGISVLIKETSESSFPPFAM